ncbi:MAG: hypothetical protein WCF36_18695 [Candidatus Nanopelagicales bacterium]
MPTDPVHSTADATSGAPSPGVDGTVPSAPCARCGHGADFEIAGLWLCIDCYHVAGSTCAGVGTLERPADPVC